MTTFPVEFRLLLRVEFESARRVVNLPVRWHVLHYLAPGWFEAVRAVMLHSTRVFSRVLGLPNWQIVGQPVYVERLVVRLVKVPVSPRLQVKNDVEEISSDGISSTLFFLEGISSTLDKNLVYSTEFFRLLAKHFPPYYRLHKNCNKFNVKVSYSFVSNMATIICKHNKFILSNKAAANSTTPPCNCRNKASYPLEGNLQKLQKLRCL